jgi:hypothetical protein
MFHEFLCRLCHQRLSVVSNRVSDHFAWVCALQLTMSDPVVLEHRMRELMDQVLEKSVPGAQAFSLSLSLLRAWQAIGCTRRPPCLKCASHMHASPRLSRLHRLSVSRLLVVYVCYMYVICVLSARAIHVRSPIPGRKPLALVVSGQALGYIFADDRLQAQFLSLAMASTAVVACRVSPPQKAAVVRMVRKHVPGNPVTLAIGDGANDVDMIKQAEVRRPLQPLAMPVLFALTFDFVSVFGQVGVGISGREGLQAVNSSDFAIAQFRFLLPLLLVHGRWSYRRMAKVFLYSFFKNVVLTFTLFYFNIFTGWSGASLYDSLVYSGFNFFLGLPIIGIGIFDR